MPKKCLPNPEDFIEFAEELLRRGFRRLSTAEFWTSFRSLKLTAPRPRFGRELGFIFEANGYTVVVWTTWLEENQVVREEDAGWILIAEGEKVLYFSHPLHRTKNFIFNMLMQARIACWRVRNRPLCPECQNFMSIARGRALKQRFWECNSTRLHKDGRKKFTSWDFGLPEEALEYLKPIRKRRVKRYAKLRAEGKEPHQAMLKRKRWEKE